MPSAVDRFEDFVYAAADSMSAKARWDCPETGNVGEKVTCILVGKNIQNATVSSTPTCNWAEETPVTEVRQNINQNQRNGQKAGTEAEQRGSGYWEDLGIYTIAQNSQVTLIPSARGKVIADAIRLIPADSSAISQPPTDIPDTINLTSANSVRTGAWATMWEEANVEKYYTGQYYYGHAAGAQTNEKAVWSINNSGRYLVSVRWQAKDNRATDAPYKVYTGATTQTINVNQTITPPGWLTLGIFTFTAGDRIELSPSLTGKVVTGDIKLTPLSNTRMSALSAASESSYLFKAQRENKIGQWSDGFAGEYKWFIHNPLPANTASNDVFYWNIGATGLSGKYLISTRWKTAANDVGSRDASAQYQINATADAGTARKWSCVPNSSGTLTIQARDTSDTLLVEDSISIDGAANTQIWRADLANLPVSGLSHFLQLHIAGDINQLTTFSATGSETLAHGSCTLVNAITATGTRTSDNRINLSVYFTAPQQTCTSTDGWYRYMWTTRAPSATPFPYQGTLQDGIITLENIGRNDFVWTANGQRTYYRYTEFVQQNRQRSANLVNSPRFGERLDDAILDKKSIGFAGTGRVDKK